MTYEPRAERLQELSPGDEHLSRRRLAVLLVDPQREAIEPLAAALNRTCDVSIARSARDAFASMSARRPDLIATELDLPDLPGAEFLARIHATPATYHVLLLVMTHHQSVHDKIAAFQAGADDYLVKPVDARDFVKHVQLLSRFQRVLGRS